jgi:hypothetical protein
MATNDNQPSHTTIATYTTNGEDKYVDKRYANVRTDVIEITHDKLENLLRKFYERHALRLSWFNPLSLGIGVALTLSTAEFKAQALALDGATWKAIFVITLVVSVVWLVFNLIQLARGWNESSLDSLIDKIKNVGGGR